MIRKIGWPIASWGVWPKIRSAPRFQDRITPSSVFVTIASSEESRTAASQAPTSSPRRFPEFVPSTGCVPAKTISKRTRNGAPARGASHASGAAEADRHLAVFDDHRHGAAPFRVAEHALERRRVSLDVQVRDREMPPLIVVTGGLRVGSRVLAENLDHSLIVLVVPPLTQNRRGRGGD